MHVVNFLLFDAVMFDKQINPSKCRYEVMSTKVEIRLAKADSIHWTSLEFRTDIPVVQRTTVSSGTCAGKVILQHPDYFQGHQIVILIA